MNQETMGTQSPYFRTVGDAHVLIIAIHFVPKDADGQERFLTTGDTSGVEWTREEALRLLEEDGIASDKMREVVRHALIISLDREMEFLPLAAW